MTDPREERGRDSGLRTRPHRPGEPSNSPIPKGGTVGFWVWGVAALFALIGLYFLHRTYLGPRQPPGPLTAPLRALDGGIGIVSLALGLLILRGVLSRLARGKVWGGVDHLRRAEPHATDEDR
jgi:hypothetical protein